MADWRKMAKQILLADGTIDDRETVAIRKELFADNSIDDVELEFLFELRSAARGVKASFNQLLIDALKNCLVADGAFKPGAISQLRRVMLADGKIDGGKKVFLQHLRAALKQPPADFEAFYQQCQAK